MKKKDNKMYNISNRYPKVNFGHFLLHNVKQDGGVLKQINQE